MLKKGLAIFGTVLFVFGILMFFSYTSANDEEIRKRSLVTSQQDVCKANFDKMFKVIAQTAQVPQEFMEKAKNAFKEIYTPLIEGRYSGEKGDALMKWITESNPNFDLNAMGKMYERLQVIIEANREEFFNEQKKLIDYQREHHNFISSWWNKNVWGLGSRGDVEIKIITSAKTKEVYSKGEENDINVFNK
jgi:hypothetical protein